jgi:excisionase family DNA binding protein
VTGPFREETSDWLTLQAASERLDVHPATLRQWADNGRVRIYRTPGGHRRFSAEDVTALAATAVPQPTPELDLLLTSALGRTRLEASDGRLAGEEWYGRLRGGARERHRALGRELLTLLVRYLRPQADLDSVLDEGREVGRKYGGLARRAGLSLPEAVRAFLLFRDVLIESVLQTKALQEHGGAVRDVVVAHRQVGAFLDEVLVALLEAHTEETR